MNIYSIKKGVQVAVSNTIAVIIAVVSINVYSEDLPNVPYPESIPDINKAGLDPTDRASEITGLELEDLLDYINNYLANNQTVFLENINTRQTDRMDYEQIEERRVVLENAMRLGEKVVDTVDPFGDPIVEIQATDSFDINNLQSDVTSELSTMETTVSEAFKDATAATVIQNKLDGYETKIDGDNYLESVSSWSESAVQALGHASNIAGKHIDNIRDSEQVVIGHLETLNETRRGRNQLLESSVLTEQESVKQVQKLRHLIGSQANAEASYYAFKAKDQAAQAQLSATYHDNSGLKDVSDMAVNSSSIADY